MNIEFTGERIVPGAANCEPTFAKKMYQEHVARYAFATQLAQGRDVLDVACGVGYGSQWLAKSGAKSVLGIDIAADAIDHAKKNYFHPSVSFEVQDATALDFDSQFDVVTCFEFIEHIDEQAKVLDAIKRALRPDGTLIISTPRPLDDKRTHFHVHELDFEELQRMLVDRFRRVDSFFERNCFTSFVGAGMPKVLDHIISMTDGLRLDDADYFIFVARTSAGLELEQTKSVLAVNDDSYVLRLEQDIVNLRNGENYHNQLISELSEKSEKLSQELGSVQSELEVQLKKAEGVDQLQQQMSSIVGDVANIREELRTSAQAASAEVAAMREELRASAELASAQAELDELRRSREELLRQNEGLIADNSRIRTVLSKVAQQLAETETRLNAKMAEADLVASLRSELASVRDSHAQDRQRFEECERTLNRFRRSVSWRLTRPVRWIGRQYKKAAGRSVA